MPLDGLIDHLNGPLCPQSYPPRSCEHTQHLDVQNRTYKAVEKNDDGEMSPDAQKMYEAIGRERMYLYRDSWRGVVGAQLLDVECFFWRCPVCGFVLPAHRVSGP